MPGGRRVVTCAFVLVACRDLPELAHGMCGNGVVEQGEDCDGATDPSRGADLACAAPGEPSACRYTCGPTSCPTGWSCGEDGVCRFGTGVWLADAPITLAHDELAVADIDGDRSGDLVAFSPRGAHVLFDDRTVIVASPDELTGPGVVTDLDGDGLADVVAPDGQGLAIGRGEIDRTVTPASYAPFPAAIGAWYLPVRVPLAGEADAVAALAPAAAGTDASLYLVPSGIMQHVAAFAADTPTSSFGPVALRADFDAPSAEDELVVAAPGHAELWQLRPTLTLANMIAMIPTRIPLTARVSDGRLLLVDVDFDGDLDVLAGALTTTGFEVSVVRNQGGQLVQDADATDYFDALATTGAALPDVPSAPRVFPLAVADLDDDGELDAVSPDAVFVRAGASHVPVYRRSTYAAWREAVIVDVDRDQRLDVVVASSSAGIDVLRNRPGGFTRVAIDTAGPATMLRAGDFDGDGLGDVAFRERAGRDRVRVLFGAIGAFAPTIAAIGLPNVNRLEVGRFRDGRDLHDAVDDLVLVGWDGARPGISFVTGSGDRRMRSVLFLTRGSRVDTPLAAVAGRFVSAGSDLAVLAVDRQGQRRLWLLAAAADLGYRVDQALTAAPLGVLATLAVHRFAAADVDGDGHHEIVALGRDPGGATQLVVVHPQGGDPPTITTVDPGVGDGLDLAVGDVDRDGVDEVFVAGTAGLTRWQRDELTSIAGEARAVSIAQLDDDAALELAIVAGSTLTIVDGATSAVQQSILGPAVTHVRAGDLDGDGVADLVLGDGFTITRMHSVPQVPR